MTPTPALLALLLATPPPAGLPPKPPADRFGDPLPPGAVARLGSARLRHPDRPLCLAFLPDGRHLASGGSDGALRVWAVADGREVRRLRVKDGTVTALAVAADGKKLAAHFYDEQVRLLAPDSLAELGTVRTPFLDALALSPDGSLVAGVGLAGKVVLRETANGLDRLDLPDGRAAAFAPDGKSVAVGATGGVTVYDVLSGEPKHRVAHPSREGVTAVAFGPDGRRLATADAGPAAQVRVWDLGVAQPAAELLAEGPVAFLPDGTLLTRRNGAVAVWDLAAKKPVREFGTGVTVFAASPDGKLVATAGNGARIAVWNRETGEELRPDGDGLGAVAGLFPGPQGLLVVGAKLAARWRPGDDLPAVAARSNDPITAAAAAGRLLLTAGPGRVALWEDLPADAVAARPTRAVDLRDAAFTAAAVTGDGSRAAVGADAKRVIVLDRAGKVLREWTAAGVPLGLAFLPNRDRLAVVARDGFARVWDLAAPPSSDGAPPVAWSARVPRSLRAGVAVSPDGSLVAVTSVVRVDVFDAATGRRAFGLERRWEDGPFQCAAFSPDGRLIAAGAMGGTGTVTVWEAATRSPAVRFAGGGGTVSRVAFLADGRHLASAGLDDNVLVWDLTGRAGKPPPSDAELATAWNALLRLDATAGHAAVRALAAGGPRGVAVIRDGIKDLANTDAKVRRWVAELDAPAFAVRENASKQLAAVGLLALPAVSAAAETSTSAEVKQRAGAILDGLRKAGEVVPAQGLYADPLRLVRAVWALELIGGPDAAAVLDSIHGTGGRAGGEAAAALRRLKK